jgi:hypothetical protein
VSIEDEMREVVSKTNAEVLARDSRRLPDLLDNTTV